MRLEKINKPKVEDKIFSFRMGNGKISEIIGDENKKYRLLVEFEHIENEKFHYTIDGKLFVEDMLPELYKGNYDLESVKCYGKEL